MIRVVAPRPEAYDLGQLLVDVRAAAPGALAVNEVADDLAAYWDDEDAALTEEQWAAIVAAHVPPEPAEAPAVTQEQLAALASFLIEHAPDLTAAVEAVAGSNSAKAALEIIDAGVQQGAAAT